MLNRDSHTTLAPWVMVCGGFHRLGGMDQANLALCETLLRQGRTVFLVAHNIDAELVAHPQVKATLVRRPLNSVLLGEAALAQTGIRVAKQVIQPWPQARVVVNGGNCPWPDINWVHSAHSMWPRCDDQAPFWFRIKGALNKSKAIRDERPAFRRARIFIANSERTKRDLVSAGVREELIHVVYLGSDSQWQPASPVARQQGRELFRIPQGTKVIAFVGALGYDRNKGFDTLLRAFREAKLHDCHLLVAGGGRGFHRWRSEVERTGLDDQVHLIGFSRQIAQVYAASDLLVSPVRYEAFGLNVQEAICRGVPAVVSATAGVAELYPDALNEYLLLDPEDHKALATILARWHKNTDQPKIDFAQFGERLRGRSWEAMAQEIITLTDATDQLCAGLGLEMALQR